MMRQAILTRDQQAQAAIEAAVRRALPVLSPANVALSARDLLVTLVVRDRT